MTDYSHNANDLTAVMASNTSPSPLVASASNEYSASYAAWKAFDHIVGTSYWSTVNTTAWLKIYSGGTLWTVTSYTISTGNSNVEAPKTWTFEGSNDNSSWTVLDTRSDITAWAVNEMRSYQIASPSNYTYYRLNVTASNHPGGLSVGQLELIGSVYTPPSSTVKRPICNYDGSLKELSSSDTLYSARTYHGIESFGVVSFNNTSHVVSVASGSNTYWYKGVRFYTADAISCDLDDHVTLEANTLYYVYFDDATGTLKANSTVWNLREKVPVATVYWNGSVGAPCNECHGHDRGVGWHINAHLTIGCRYYEGLNVLKPTTSLDSALEIEAGTLFDEDIQIDITPAKTNCRIWYLASSGKYTFVNSDLPYAGTLGQPQYLDTDTYALVDVGTSQYVCMWVYGTGDTDRPIYIFPSAISTPYTTIAGARAEAIPVLSGLGLNPELKLLHRFIFRGNGEFQESADFRRSSSLPSGFVASTSAGSVSFIPYDDITGTNVQNAIQQTVDLINALPSTYYGTGDPPTPTGYVNGSIYLKYVA